MNRKNVGCSRPVLFAAGTTIISHNTVSSPFPGAVGAGVGAGAGAEAGVSSFSAKESICIASVGTSV